MLHKINLILGEASLKGIKLSYLFDALTDKDRFQELEIKSLDEFVKTDLRDLMEELKPDHTPTKKYFYADYLEERHGNSLVGEGEVFIACERKIKFLDMMKTLKDHFRIRPHIHVCIDSITHGMPIEDGTLDEELYENRIKEIGYVVIVMSPWNNIRFFRRTALLFEVYSAIKHGCKVEVAMTSAEKKTLICLVRRIGIKGIKHVFELVGFEKSQSALLSMQDIKEKVRSDKSFDDANMSIINVVWDCLTVILKSSELELPPYQYTQELSSFQQKMKDFALRKPNMDGIFRKNEWIQFDFTRLYDEVASLIFFDEEKILEENSIEVVNSDTFEKVTKIKGMMKNQNIFRIYSDIIIGVLGNNRDPMAIKFFDLYVYSLFLSNDKNEQEEAEVKLHQLMMLWESDIDEIIPDDNSVNSIKITFKTALPLSYYRYMQKAKNAKSLLLCLKNTEYGGAWRITMIGISRQMVRCECSSGKPLKIDGKFVDKRHVDWEVEEMFRSRPIYKTPVMGNFKGVEKWHPGQIFNAHDDGTFDIIYDDDGRIEKRVEPSSIQVKFSENMDEKIVYLQKRKNQSETSKGQKWNPKRAFFAPIPKFYCSCKEYTLLGVNPVKQTFQADAVFEFRLNEIGKDVSCERYVLEYFSEYGLDLKNIIDFRGEIFSGGYGGKESGEHIFLYEPTTSIQSFMYDYTIQCRKQSEYKADKLDLHNFPFDQLELSLSIRLNSSKLFIELEIDSQDYSEDFEEVYLEGDKFNRKKLSNNQLQYFNEYRFIFNDPVLKKPWMKPNKAKSEMTYLIFVQRDFSFYIYSTIMPLVNA